MTIALAPPARIGTVEHPLTGDKWDVLDRRGLFRCRHRFLFRTVKPNEGYGYFMVANASAAAHLVECQRGFMFGWRTNIGVRAGL